MKDDIERRDAHAEGRGDLFAWTLFQDAQSDGTSVTRVDGSQGPVDPHSRLFEVTLFGELDVCPSTRLALRCVDRALEIIGLEQRLALASAEHVESDAHRDDAEPGIDSGALPLELNEALDDAGVCLGERVLGSRLRTEPRQEHGAVEHRPVRPQNLPESGSIARLRTLAENTLRFEIRSDERHGLDDTRSRRRVHSARARQRKALEPPRRIGAKRSGPNEAEHDRKRGNMRELTGNARLNMQR